MLTEVRKEQIRKEARGILDKFGKTLAKVSVPKENFAENGEGVRREDNVVCDKDFRERLFGNAPSKNKDCIIAEKASW